MPGEMETESPRSTGGSYLYNGNSDGLGGISCKWLFLLPVPRGFHHLKDVRKKQKQLFTMDTPIRYSKVLATGVEEDQLFR